MLTFLNLRGGSLRINCDAIASVEVSGETVAVALMNERVHFFSGEDAAAVLRALEPEPRPVGVIHATSPEDALRQMADSYKPARNESPRRQGKKS